MAKLLCVATDFMVHGSWPTTDVETYVVATDASRETLSSRGIPRDRIAVLGIPIRLRFQSLPDRASARQTWNVPLNMPAVLTAAGSADRHTGIYKKIRTRLSALIEGAREIRDLSLYIITGNDAALKIQLEDMTRTYDLPHVHILSYVEDIGGLMRAMDGLILKPGGLISAEALAAELPLFLVGPNVGQELENERYLTTIGAARMLPGTADDLQVVRTMLGSHEAMAAMREACTRARKPEAAISIARHIHALLQENHAS
jgi:processive 1,2-diacylglycerol beta-glucosyltransferase